MSQNKRVKWILFSLSKPPTKMRGMRLSVRTERKLNKLIKLSQKTQDQIIYNGLIALEKYQR